MPYPCFKCDVELVAGARYCHQCGAPNLLQQPGRRAAEVAVEEEERYRIKRDIQEAATVPTGTRMLQTVLPSPPPRPRTPIRPRSLPERLIASRFWTNTWLWLLGAGLAFLAASSSIIIGLTERLQDGGTLNRALTRLAARCPKDSKAQLMGQVEAIRKASAGARSPGDAALLLDLVAHELPVADGSCARIADRLAQPNRFGPLLP